jgi:uncharacterized membrane protein
MHERRQGALFLVTVIVAWGLTWPVNKLVLASVPPLWTVTLRSVISVLVLFVLAAAHGRLVVPPRGDLPVLLSITLLHMVGFTVLTSFGLSVVPAGRSVVLAYTTPLWVTPGAWLFLGERLTARRTVGVLIGLLGLVTLFNPFAFDWTSREAVLGNAAILLGALLWAGSILHIRGHRWRSTAFGRAVDAGTRRLAALRRHPRDGASLLGDRDGHPPPAGVHDLSGPLGNAGLQRRRQHAVASRATERLAGGGDPADPRRHRDRRGGRARGGYEPAGSRRMMRPRGLSVRR